MGKSTDIAWADATWNPWIGCKKVSEGCKYCYMFREMKMYGKNPDIISRTSVNNWNQPKHWEPKRIFTCSWSDFFISDADEYRPDAWKVIESTPWHEWCILTKRIKASWSRLPDGFTKHFNNVRLGISVENQGHVDRIEDLFYIPGIHNFVSVEPLIGEVDLTKYLDRLEWVIVGGETDNLGYARPINPEWIEKIVRDCKQSNVPVFVKQLGSHWKANSGAIEDDPAFWNESLRVREFPDFLGDRNEYKKK